MISMKHSIDSRKKVKGHHKTGWEDGGALKINPVLDSNSRCRRYIKLSTFTIEEPVEKQCGFSVVLKEGKLRVRRYCIIQSLTDTHIDVCAKLLLRSIQ